MSRTTKSKNEKIKKELMTQMEIVLTKSTSPDWFLQPLSLEEVLCAIKYMPKDFDWYRENPKILSSQLAFLASEIEKS